MQVLNSGFTHSTAGDADLVKLDIDFGEDGGPSITSAIQGLDFPLGLLLADFPDVLRAMAT